MANQASSLPALGLLLQMSSSNLSDDCLAASYTEEVLVLTSLLPLAAAPNQPTCRLPRRSSWLRMKVT